MSVIKNYKLITGILTILFFVPSGCENNYLKDKTFEECIMSFNCIETDGGIISPSCACISFLDGVSMYSTCKNVYVIQGEALDSHEHGRHIKFIKDLKGNFPKGISIFTAWGGGGHVGVDSNGRKIFIGAGRLDNFANYKKNDHLILLLSSVASHEYKCEFEFECFEKPEDYSTFECIPSILELSNGNVSGYIINEESGNLWQTMSWNKFENKLSEVLNF